MFEPALLSRCSLPHPSLASKPDSHPSPGPFQVRLQLRQFKTSSAGGRAGDKIAAAAQNAAAAQRPRPRCFQRHLCRRLLPHTNPKPDQAASYRPLRSPATPAAAAHCRRLPTVATYCCFAARRSPLPAAPRRLLIDANNSWRGDAHSVRRRCAKAAYATWIACNAHAASPATCQHAGCAQAATHRGRALGAVSRRQHLARLLQVLSPVARQAAGQRRRGALHVAGLELGTC